MKYKFWRYFTENKNSFEIFFQRNHETFNLSLFLCDLGDFYIKTIQIIIF